MKLGEGFIKKLINHMVDGYLYCRIETNVKGEPEDFVILDANVAFQKITGIPIDKAIGKKITKVCPELSKGKFNWIQKLGYVALNESEQIFAHHIEKLKKWLQIRAFSPERAHIAVIITDITARQHADEDLQKQNEQLKFKLEEKEAEIQKISLSLKQTEAKYENLINGIPILFYKSNPESLQSTYVSKTIEDLYGYNREEWISNPDLWAKSIHPDDRDRVLSLFEQTRITRKNNTIQYRIIRKDSQEKYIQDTFFWEFDENNNIVSLNGFIQELSPEKSKEQPEEIQPQKLEKIQTHFDNILSLREQLNEFKKREAKLRLLTTHLADIFWEWDLSNGKINWLGKAEELLGLSANELPYNIDLLKQLINPDDYNQLIANLNAPMPEEEPFFINYCRINHKDGTFRTWLTRSIIYKDDSGKPSKMLNACSDITPQIAQLASINTLNIDLIETLQQLLSISVSEQIYQEFLSIVNKFTKSKTAYLFHKLDNDSFTSYIIDTINDKLKQEITIVPKDLLNPIIIDNAIVLKESYIFNEPMKVFTSDENTTDNILIHPIKDNEELFAILALTNKETEYKDNDLENIKLITKLFIPLFCLNMKHKAEQDKLIAKENELEELKRQLQYQEETTVLNKQLENTILQIQELIQNAINTLGKYPK